LRLSGIRHAQFATALLPGSETCSHESTLNATLAYELIHLTQHFRGLQFLRSEASHDANRDSAVERGRRAFAADIGKRDAELLRPIAQKFVEIAAHFAR